MKPEEKQKLKLIVVQNAKYYGQDLDDHVIQMYTADLADLGLDAVSGALQRLRRDPATTRFPLPAKIRAALDMGLSAPDAARLAVSQIWVAIGRFGWPNPEAAKKNMGAFAWEVVERSGSWEELCKSSGQTNEGTFKAQIRDLAESLYRRAEQGKLDEDIAIPQVGNEIKANGEISEREWDESSL